MVVRDGPRAPARLVIASENDAWNWIQSALDNSADFSDLSEIIFEGWPEYRVKLDTGNASVKSSLMEAFLSLQENLNRAYSLVRYDSSNLNKLTNEEKQALELEFFVRRGSSDVKTDPKHALADLGRSAVAKMNGRQAVIAVLGVALIYFGNSTLNGYLQGRLEMRRAEIASREKVEQLAAQRFLSDQETQRMQILERALGASRVLPEAADHADEANRTLLKKIPPDAEAIIGQTQIDGYVANELAKNPRNESRVVTIRGRFTILRVDTTSLEGFRVRLKNLETDDEITAMLRDALLSEADKAAIQAAEWGKLPIDCVIEVTRRGGQTVDAVITEVVPVEG